MRSHLLSCLAAAAVACVLPAVAGAATLDADGSGNLTFGLPGDANGLIVDTSACEGLGFGTCIHLSELSGELIQISAAAQAYCDHTPGSPGDTAECAVPPQLTANLGAGDDVFRADTTVGSRLVVNGGDGNDQIKGGAGNDSLHGQAGNDAVAGRGGNDTIDGGDGIDIIESQVDSETPDRGTTPFNSPTTGADSLGADTLIGGPGRDNLSYSPIEPLPGGIAISLDGRANDGHGGGDNVGSDIEVIHGSPGDDTIVGDEARNELDGREGNDTVSGRGGDDLVTGYNGNDRLYGEAGADTVYGYSDDDTVDGGPGRDQIDGDAPPGLITVRVGNDTLLAADGELDGVRCGLGADIATVDAGDVTDGCEQLDVRGTGSSSGANGGGGGAGPGVAAWSVETIGRLRLRTALRKGIRLKLQCAGRCRVTISLTYRRRVVARGRHALPRAGSKTVQLKFTRQGRKRLRRVKSARLVLRVTVTDAAGATDRRSAGLVVTR